MDSNVICTVSPADEPHLLARAIPFEVADEGDHERFLNHIRQAVQRAIAADGLGGNEIDVGG